MTKKEETIGIIDNYLNQIEAMNLSEESKMYYKDLIIAKKSEASKVQDGFRGEIVLGLVLDDLKEIMENARRSSREREFSDKLDAADREMKNAGISLSDKELDEIRKLIGDTSNNPKKL